MIWLNQTKVVIVLLLLVMAIFLFVQEFGAENAGPLAVSKVQSKESQSSALGNGVITFKKIGGNENG